MTIGGSGRSSAHCDLAGLLERLDARVGEVEGSAAGAGMDRRLLRLAERGQQLVEVQLEHVVEVAVAIVEVAGLPDLAYFVAWNRPCEPLDRVDDLHPPG